MTSKVYINKNRTTDSNSDNAIAHFLNESHEFCPPFFDSYVIIYVIIKQEYQTKVYKD